jgi:hypothetical protein
MSLAIAVISSIVGARLMTRTQPGIGLDTLQTIARQMERRSPRLRLWQRRFGRDRQPISASENSESVVQAIGWAP